MCGGSPGGGCQLHCGNGFGLVVGVGGCALVGGVGFDLFYGMDIATLRHALKLF
jgi:hypothetical protein